MSNITAYPVSVTINKILEPLIEYPVIKYEYDDGGCSTNVQVCGLKRFILTYQGLSSTDFQTIITHFNLAEGLKNYFDFVNPHDSVTYENVFYENLSIGEHVKSWALNLEVTLRTFA